MRVNVNVLLRRVLRVHLIPALILCSSIAQAAEFQVKNYWVPAAGIYVSVDEFSKQGKSDSFLSKDLGVPKRSFLVNAIGKGSAAEQAGLKLGDVILVSEKGFFKLFDKTNSTVKFTVRRGKKKIRVTIAERKHESGKIRFQALPPGGGKTIRVSAFGSGRYRTITAALARARLGDTISVGAGEYRENLVIPGGVKLVADGPAQIVASSPIKIIGVADILIEGFELSPVIYKNKKGEDAANNAVSIFASKNITLTGLIVNQPLGTAVRIVRSAPVTISKGSISGSKTAQGVTMSSSTVRISDTRFDGLHTGIRGYKNVVAELTGNLFDQVRNGVISGSGSRVTATGNTLYGLGYDDSVYGFYAVKTQLTGVENTIRGFKRGVNATNSDVILQDNFITGNLYGVLLYSGTAKIEKNTISRNRWDGVVLRRAKKPRKEGDEPVVLTGNAILDNTSRAIFIAKRKNIHMAENLLQGNGTGLGTSEASFTFSRNTLASNRYGLKIEKDSQGVIENNIIAYNSYGIAIDASAKVKLSLNNVFGNLARKTFPLSDGNYLRWDYLPTEKGDKLRVRIYPAYDLKGETDISVKPHFVAAGKDYRLKADTPLAGFFDRGQSIGAFPIVKTLKKSDKPLEEIRREHAASSPAVKTVKNTVEQTEEIPRERAASSPGVQTVKKPDRPSVEIPVRRASYTTTAKAAKSPKIKRAGKIIPVKALGKFAGRWRMNAKCSTGKYIITINLTVATASRVAGTTTSTSGFSTRILDGKVSGNTIRFRRRTSNFIFKITDTVTGRLSSASRMTGTIIGGTSNCTFIASR